MERYVSIAKKRLLLALMAGAVAVAGFSAEPEQEVEKESLLKGFSGDSAPVLDLDHDLASYFHSKDLLKRKMELLANCGFDRVYIIAPPPGEPDYSMRLVPDDNVNFLRQTREALGDDALKLSIAYAKEAGLKAFIVMKPYEGGGSFSVPHNFVPPCERNWIETISGRAVGLDPFILEHPEMRVKRRPTDEKLSQPVDRIEMVFVLDRIPGRDGLRNQNGVMEIVRRPDRPHLGEKALTDYPAKNFVLYTSSDNGRYYRSSGPAEVSDKTDYRQIYSANGEPIFDEPVFCRVITLSGLNLTSPYFAVSFAGDRKAFRTIPYSESCFIAYSGTNQLPITVSPRVRDGLLTGKNGFMRNGFEFEEIGPYYWDYGWKTECLFGIARGKEEYQRAALCEAYPEVRAYWLEQIQHYMDLGCDGVDIRLQSHSVGITDFVNYGFNQPLLDAYTAKYGSAESIDPIQMMKVRGTFFMDFLKHAAALLHTADLPLQLHMNSYLENPTLDPTFPGAGFWASPKVVPDWKEMVAVADEVTMKDYNWGVYSSEKAGAIKDSVSAAGKPLWIHCYMQQGHDLNDVFLDQVESDSRVTGMLLYEVKYSKGSVNDGMVEFTDDGTVRLVPGSPIFEKLKNPPAPLPQGE
jgi:hypothetical protein